jgi:hypothetical protein
MRLRLRARSGGLLRLSWPPEAFRWLLERHGKLNVLEMTESSDYRFILAICGK